MKEWSSAYQFPAIETASLEGLVAIGGDLEPSTLLEAYSKGIFPWFTKNSPVLWWSLNPRMILYPQNLHISKSLIRIIKSEKYSVSFDTDFDSVIRNCAAAKRKGENETWITSEMIEAYTKLHRMGYVHSTAVYQNGRLAGGLYGVALGKVFFGESMFALERDASKVALVKLAEKLSNDGFHFIDCQQDTAHMARMGAITVSINTFNEMLARAMKHITVTQHWD